MVSCSIHPNEWTPSPQPEFEGKLSLNDKLTNATIIDLLGYQGAEDFAVHPDGSVYCGVHAGKKDFSSGSILRIKPDNSVEEYLATNGWATGMQFDKDGNLITLINNLGLVRIRTDKSIDTLVTHTPEGEPVLTGAGLKIASDGTIYFVNISSSNRISARYINKIILELKPTGGVYSYNPFTQITETISDGNYFGNGLEISSSEDFILVSETSKYRILKYWIRGEKKGSSEVFIDNLAGFPNNISKNSRGNFWVGFTTKRNEQLDKAHPKAGTKKLIYGLPSFIKPKPEKFGMVMEISGKGEIIQSLFDPEGSTVTEAGAVLEHKGYLYLGGDVVSYVSKSRLN